MQFKYYPLQILGTWIISHTQCKQAQTMKKQDVRAKSMTCQTVNCRYFQIITHFCSCISPQPYERWAVDMTVRTVSSRWSWRAWRLIEYEAELENGFDPKLIWWIPFNVCFVCFLIGKDISVIRHQSYWKNHIRIDDIREMLDVWVGRRGCE